MPRTPLIVGAGPAGLAAALEYYRHGIPAVVLESDAVVGGICRTVEYKGYRFDIGGHRFFTKNREIMGLWEEFLGDELLERPRLSRIYFNRKFFYYPLRPFNALLNLGAIETARVLFHYVWARVRPYAEEKTFEHWVSNRFGRRLYEIFFKTYTEKLWGIPCERISAEWVAQRIKGLSLARAITNAFLGDRQRKVTTLIEQFHYPRFGPGQLYDAIAGRLRDAGTDILLRHAVQAVQWEHTTTGRRVTTVICSTPEGEKEFPGEQVISSMPLDLLILGLRPLPPEDVLGAARQLRYRSLVTVNLIIRRQNAFPDNWIYVHDPQVKVGRIQNFKNWSPWMVPDHGTTSLGMEYFVNEGDDFWRSSDSALLDQAAHELVTLRFIDRAAEVQDGFVVRMPRTYCVHDSEYQTHVATIRGYLDTFTNLQPVGRYGMFKYNNQDHSILTGLLAVRNWVDGTHHDIWSVNTEQEYHEERRADREEGAHVSR